MDLFKTVKLVWPTNVDLSLNLKRLDTDIYRVTGQSELLI